MLMFIKNAWQSSRDVFVTEWGMTEHLTRGNPDFPNCQSWIIPIVVETLSPELKTCFDGERGLRHRSEIVFRVASNFRDVRSNQSKYFQKKVHRNINLVFFYRRKTWFIKKKLKISMYLSYFQNKSLVLVELIN